MNSRKEKNQPTTGQPKKVDVKPNNLDGLILIGVYDNPYITQYGLTGANMKYGIVDGGNVLPTHQEFANITNRVILNNSSLSNDNHATHVAGTSCAVGVEPQAKGVAPEALIYSYDFYNATTNINDCGANSINAVNNSWGLNRGWYYSGDWDWLGFDYDFYIANYQTNPTLVEQDPWFGKYTTYSETRDSESHTYPNMLLCWAAGNDRTDTGPSTGQDWYIRDSSFNWVLMDGNTYPAPNPDEGFRTIGPYESSKNVLTVGASIDSDGTTTNFSSWGPTDDLRIKPEVVANGELVFSCISSCDTCYASYSGTSMACPFATGCAILIQQFCQEQLSYFPISSTTKGCIIHGASVTGIPGNENINGSHGYGLINMNNTLEFLDKVKTETEGFNLYNDIEITNSETEKLYTYENAVNGSLVVTLCWTDLPGVGNDDDFTQPPDDKSIVNRLALYVEHEDSTGTTTFYYPYRLAGYDANATMETSSTYDDTKIISYDNTQKIIIPTNSLSGTIKVHVKRDNTLTGGSQKFSLAVSLDATFTSSDITAENIYVTGQIYSSNTDLNLNAGSNLAVTALESNGNVGVGTATPSEKLEVNGDVKLNKNMYLTGPNSTETISVQDGTGRMQTYWNSTIGPNSKYLANDPAFKLDIPVFLNPYFNIKYAPSGAAGQNINWQTHFSIKQDGNIGIGTTTPSEKLEINGNVKLKKQLYLTGGTSTETISVQDGTGRMQTYWNSTIGVSPKYLANDPAFKLDIPVIHDNYYNIKFAPTGTAGQNINWQTHFSIRQNGNVGIGTTRPQYKLDVNGQVRAIGGYLPFTGMHEYPLGKCVDKTKLKEGMIMVSTGCVSKEHEPCIKLSSESKQKSVIGVFVKLNEDETKAQINSVGDGQLLVVSPLDNNCCPTEKIEAGDFITTSALPGYGIKQVNDIHMNYTIAKSNQNCTFSKKDSTTICYNGKKYRVQSINCSYNV